MHIYILCMLCIHIKANIKSFVEFITGIQAIHYARIKQHHQKF